MILMKKRQRQLERHRMKREKKAAYLKWTQRAGIRSLKNLKAWFLARVRRGPK